jgi:hypothetical protein
MQDLRNTLAESLVFYREQEGQISARLALLPKGRIKIKKIGPDSYFYLQYRKGRSIKSDYLGKDVPQELLDRLEERGRLESELRRVREGLKLLKSKKNSVTDLTEPLSAILRTLTEQKLWESGLEIIGTWCFLLYQKHLPVEKYPLKTEDLDILVPRPYRGREFDLSGYLKGLGFSQDFNPDGSTYFSGNRMKIEFIGREKGSGERRPAFIKEIAVTPQLLRFVDILFAEPIDLKVARGIKARVPSPAAFTLHKLILATRFKRGEKREKDIRQAIYAGKYILTERSERQKLLRLWASFPRSWKKKVREALRMALAVVPLEEGVVRQLERDLS